MIRSNPPPFAESASQILPDWSERASGVRVHLRSRRFETRNHAAFREPARINPLVQGPVAAARDEVQVESLRPIPRYSASQKLRGRSKRHSAHGLTDPLDLVQVKKVVTGVQLEMVRETFLASLYVNTDALQIFRLGAAYQPEVRLSKDRKHGDRLARIGVGVAESGGPRILVVARQWWAILRED